LTHPDILVIGGGIIGLGAARELALLGYRVEVVERLAAGAEASMAAAGMISPLDETSTPGPFFDACRDSRDLWGPWVAALEEETGMSIDYDTSGALLVAVDDEEEAALDRTLRLAGELGEEAEEVEGHALRHWVPDITPEVRRALHLSGDHRVDNVQACAVLARAAQGRGVLIHHDSEVELVEIRQPEGTVLVSGHHWRKEAALVVLAAGAWSGRIPGLPVLPVRPVRGQMLLLGGVDWPWNGSVRAGARHYAVRRGATGLLVGSTQDEAGFDKHTSLGGLEELLGFARRSFAGLGGARVEAFWAGLRPGTPDGLPILGRLPGLPVLVATGHFRNGILLAPWTAREIARLATSDTVDTDLAPFSPTRFAGV